MYVLTYIIPTICVLPTRRDWFLILWSCMWLYMNSFVLTWRDVQSQLHCSHFHLTGLGVVQTPHRASHFAQCLIASGSIVRDTRKHYWTRNGKQIHKIVWLAILQKCRTLWQGETYSEQLWLARLAHTICSWVCHFLWHFSWVLGEGGKPESSI